MANDKATTGELADLKKAIEAEQAAIDAKRDGGKVKAALRDLEKLKAERFELELRERLEEETGEKFGDGLAMLRTVKGPVVLKRGLPILYHRFTKTAAKKLTDEATEEFVDGITIYPPAGPERAKLFEDLPGILTDAANAGVQLYGFRGKELSGKS